MEESSKHVLLCLNLDNANKYSIFNLEKSVCNHGFFMMAPNTWSPSNKSLTRPLRLADDLASLLVTITQPPTQTCDFLHVKVHGVHSLSESDTRAILDQVSRMLRLSSKDAEDIENFHKVNPEAKEKGFGRMFRSPTLFEDIIKSILLSNCQWQRTLEMAQSLCGLQHKTARRSLTNFTNKPYRKHTTAEGVVVEHPINFPSATELASYSEEFLSRHGNLGYRAKIILSLAKRIVSGKLDIGSFEMEESSQELFLKLTKLKGIGPFVGASIMMCIGFYDKVPIDSETSRHLHQIYGIVLPQSTNKRKAVEIEDPSKAPKYGSTERDFSYVKKATWKSLDIHVKNIYDKYAPFQCLAFWMELMNYYESKVGKLSQLTLANYHLVTGTAHRDNM